MEINVPTRAAYGYIEGTRADKAGRKPQKVKTNIVPSKGMFSTKEMEQQMIEVAKDVGASEDQIRVVPYKQGKAPMEANPRHRGLGTHWDKRPSEPREVKRKEFIKPRRVFSGVALPKTPEEVEAAIAEFEARKALYI